MSWTTKTTPATSMITAPNARKRIVGLHKRVVSGLVLGTGTLGWVRAGWSRIVGCSELGERLAVENGRLKHELAGLREAREKDAASADKLHDGFSKQADLLATADQNEADLRQQLQEESQVRVRVCVCVCVLVAGTTRLERDTYVCVRVPAPTGG